MQIARIKHRFMIISVKMFIKRTCVASPFPNLFYRCANAMLAE